MSSRRPWRGSHPRAKLAIAAVVVLAAASGAISLATASRGKAAKGKSAECPAALAAHVVDATAVAEAARAWGLHQRPHRFVVGLLSTSPYSLGTDAVWRTIARQQCGSRVASRSWVAFYYSPDRTKSADLAEGVDYFAKTSQGWKQWYAYR